MAENESVSTEHTGRYAEDVLQIPASGWKQILKRTAAEFSNDNITLIAGGATFFLILAIFPALAAFVALYGLLFDPSVVEGQVQALAGVLPGAATELITSELERLAGQPPASLGFGFFFGLAVSLWSANAGMKALFAAMNVAYDEDEERGFVKLTLLSLAFTLVTIIGGAVLLVVIAAIPAALGTMGLGPTAQWAIAILRWPVLLLVLMLGFGALYKFGASRTPPRWKWISWGTAVTAILWVLASAAFSFYLSNFANYNATYGSLGAVIGFMMWMYVSLVILLAGAELNSEIEHQVVTDTTVGDAKPLGERQARKADTLP